jgi:hypothetical protein
MRHTATIILIENSTAGRPPKQFTQQTIEIIREPDTIVQGADGLVSTASHPSTLTWFEGTRGDLATITDVKVVGVNGTTFIEGALNLHFEPPQDIRGGGVRFNVL